MQQLNEDEKLIIYADGACRGNQFTENIGAYGIVLLYKGHMKTLKQAFKNTTNNKMEIIAIIEALKVVKNYDLYTEVYTDSQYVVCTLNDGWKRNKNIELWNELDELISRFKCIKFIKVKGHDGDTYNELADSLCNQAIDEIN